MTIRRFYADPERFSEPSVVLDQDETRHLRDVLRLRAGDEIRIFDGVGREFRGIVEAVEKRRTLINDLMEVPPTSPESPLDLTIAAVLLKGDKLDLVVQKAVELGVNRFIPMTSTRCDVKVGDAAKRAERWRRIAMEATKQCGRARLMEVANVADYSRLLDATDDPDLTRIHFSERDGQNFEAVSGSTRILAFIGPEGGWDDTELEKAKAAGIVSITFGGRILKADTAAISIASILQHRFGDMN